MRFTLLKPRDLARTLRLSARKTPEQVEDYLEGHSEEWSALVEATPGEAADILEAIGGAAAGELLTDLDADDAAEVLEELRDELAAEILSGMSADDAAGLLTEMEPEDAADVLAAVDDADRIEELLTRMDTESEVRQLLAYAPDSAGGLMTTDVAALPVGMTVGEAIERIRHLQEELEHLAYVYVVDDQRRLLGVISFRDLVFSRPGRGLDEVMVTDPVKVHTSTDREEIAELVQRYNLVGVPVVDFGGVLQGMVAADEIIEAIRQEASEDFALAMGAGSAESVHSPVKKSLRARLPWIVLDVFLSFSVVIVISRFESVLNSFTVLAALMPLVARVGGDAGAQSLAVVIRGIAVDSIPPSLTKRVLKREMIIGAVNGVIVGLLSGVLGMTMQALLGGEQAVHIGFVMTIAAFANLTIAGLAGSGVPLLMRRLGLDPAVASSLFTTTISDLIGFGGFLAVATALL